MTGLLRYGVFDEFGFSGDQEYPNYFTVADRSFSLSSSRLPSRSIQSRYQQCFKHIAYRIHRMKTMIFVSQDLPNWYKQCNAHRLLDPQVRKPPVTKWQNVKKSKTPFGVFIVAGYTGERKKQWKSDKMWRKSLNPIWCFHCCSQERLLPLRPNSRRVLLQIGGPKQVHI